MADDKVAQRARSMNDEWHGGVIRAADKALEDLADVAQAGGSVHVFLAAFVRDAAVGKGRTHPKALELWGAAINHDSVSGGDVRAALVTLLGTLAGDMEDSMNAAALVGAAAAAAAAAGKADLADVIKAAVRAGEEPLDEGGDWGLVDSGHAAAFVGEALGALGADDAAAASTAWKSAAVPLKSLLPSFDQDQGPAVIAKYGLDRFGVAV